MSEKATRKRVVKALKPLHAVAVENSVVPGTPDVNYVGGWIELKQADEWPVMMGPLRMPHYTPQQRIWHRKRRAAGGSCFVLLQVAQEWLLFDATVAAEVLGTATRVELVYHAEMHWLKWPGDQAFLDLIRVVSHK